MFCDSKSSSYINFYYCTKNIYIYEVLFKLVTNLLKNTKSREGNALGKESLKEMSAGGEEMLIESVIEKGSLEREFMRLSNTISCSKKCQLL